jgi:hypothetical protein
LAGDVIYSSVVNVSLEPIKPTVAGVPNPVEGDVMNIQFENQPKGFYQLEILNGAALQLLSATISLPGGVDSHALSLPHGMARGIYHLEIVAPDKSTETRGVVLVLLCK